MIAAPFGYRQVNHIEEALSALKDDPEGTKLLAGGHSLLPLMKLHLAAPRQVIDIAHIQELAGIKDESAGLWVGGVTVHRDIANHPAVRESATALSMAASKIGDMQVRNRGTIGGSLAHADPSADLPAALMALDATVMVQSLDGSRMIPIEQFFVAGLVNALEPGEMVVGVKIPKAPSPTRSWYLKHPHPASGFALAGVAVSMTAEPNGRIVDIRIGVTGCGIKPFRARGAEDALSGQVLSPGLAREAGQIASEQDGEFWGDAMMSAAYRQQLCQVFVHRALLEGAADA